MGERKYSLYADYLSCVINNSNQQTPVVLKEIINEYIELGLRSYTLSVYKSLGTYYRHQNQYELAHECLEEAIELNVNNYPFVSLVPSLYQHKGLLYYKQGDYKKAIDNLNRSISLSEKYNQPITKLYALRCLYKIDTIKGDYRKAFFHLSKVNRLNKMNQNKSEKQLVKMMEVSLNLKKVTDENRRLKIVRNNIIYLSVITLILLCTLFVWRVYSNKLKSLKRIEKEKQKNQAFQSMLMSLGEKRLLKSNKNIDIEVLSENNSLSSLYEDFEECYAESIKKIKKLYPWLYRSDHASIIGQNMPL